MEDPMTDVVMGGLNTDELLQDFNKTLVAGSAKRVMGAIGAKSRDLWMVPIDSLRVIEGFNVRVRNASLRAHIGSLAGSMKSEGFLPQHALLGFVAKEGDQEVVYITDGHCRLEAVHLANAEGAEIQAVPVVISPSGVSMEDLTVGIGRGNSGKKLEAFELAVIAKRLSRWGWEHKEISDRMGVSLTTVQNYMALMGAPREIRDMVAEEVVGMHTALEAMRTHGAAAVEHLKSAASKRSEPGKGHGKKVERRDVMAPSFGSSIKKAAPRLYATISAIRSDSGYKRLSEDTRSKLESLVTELEELRSKAEAAAVKANAGSDSASSNSQAEEERGEAVPA